MSQSNDRIAARKAELEKLFGRRIRGVEKDLFNEYYKAHRAVREKLLNLYSNFKGQPTLFQASQYNRLTNLERQITEIIAGLNKTQARKIVQMTKNEFGDAYYGIGYQLETGLQANLRFGLLNPAVIEKAVENPLTKVKWQENQTIELAKLKNGVRSEVTQGLQLGRSPKETSLIIKKKFGDHFNNHIPRIVRTESQRVRSWGELTGDEQAKQYAKDLGIDLKRRWLSTLDQRTRDAHVDVDGQYEDKAGNFTFYDGVTTPGPLLSGVAKHDIECRCTTIDEVDGETPQMRYDQEQGKNVPFKNFKDYKTGWIKKRVSRIKQPAELVKGKAGPPAKGVKPTRVTEAPKFVNVKKAEQFAEKYLARRVDYEGLNIKMANTINNTLMKLKNQTKIKFDQITCREFNHWAEGNTEAVMAHYYDNFEKINRLCINAPKLMEYEKIYSRNGGFAYYSKALVRDKFWSADGIDGCVNHEFGHMLTRDSRLRAQAIETGPRDIKRILKDVPFISKYGKTDIFETLAEIYAKYQKSGRKGLKPGHIDFFNKYSKVVKI